MGNHNNAQGSQILAVDLATFSLVLKKKQQNKNLKNNASAVPLPLRRYL
jgi:hypothetical protein